MSRPGRTLLLLATVAGFLVTAPAHAGCTSAYPVTDKHVASIACTGVRPGTLLRVPSKKYGELDCAAGFVFADALGNRYVSVPGTCFLDFDCLEDVITDQLPPPLDQLGKVLPCLLPSDSELEPVYKNGPVVRDVNDGRIGSIVYAVNKSGINFALIRIDKGIPVDPAVPLYGGPTRLAGASATPEEAYVYSGRADGLPNAVTGQVYLSGGKTFHLPGLLTALWGAPVVKPDGGGVGYYSGDNYVGEGAEVMSYGPALAREERHARIKLTLLTAKAAP